MSIHRSSVYLDPIPLRYPYGLTIKIGSPGKGSGCRWYSGTYKNYGLPANPASAEGGYIDGIHHNFTDGSIYDRVRICINRIYEPNSIQCWLDSIDLEFNDDGWGPGGYKYGDVATWKLDKRRKEFLLDFAEIIFKHLPEYPKMLYVDDQITTAMVQYGSGRYFVEE